MRSFPATESGAALLHWTHRRTAVQWTRRAGASMARGVVSQGGADLCRLNLSAPGYSGVDLPPDLGWIVERGRSRLTAGLRQHGSAAHLSPKRWTDRGGYGAMTMQMKAGQLTVIWILAGLALLPFAVSTAPARLQRAGLGADVMGTGPSRGQRGRRTFVLTTLP